MLFRYRFQKDIKWFAKIFKEIAQTFKSSIFSSYSFQIPKSLHTCMTFKLFMSFSSTGHRHVLWFIHSGCWEHKTTLFGLPFYIVSCSIFLNTMSKHISYTRFFWSRFCELLWGIHWSWERSGTKHLQRVLPIKMLEPRQVWGEAIFVPKLIGKLNQLSYRLTLDVGSIALLNIVIV